MPVAFSSSANRGRFCPQRAHNRFANQSIMIIRSARTQSVELAVALTTLNNISFGCLRERPSLAFPERPRDVNGSQNKEMQPRRAAVHTPHFSFSFFDGSGEADKRRKRMWLWKERRKEKGKEGRREGETETEDGGRKEKKEGGKITEKVGEGWRKEQEGREWREEGGREGEREKSLRERDREIDKEIERQRETGLALRLSDPHWFTPRSQIASQWKAEIKLTT